MNKTRNEVPHQDQWNVEALFPDFSSWQQAFESSCHTNKESKWPEIQKFRGCLGESPDKLKQALDALFTVDRNLSRLYTYAHLRHDEELTHDQHKSNYVRITTLLHDFAKETSWFEPELTSLPENTLKTYLESDPLKDYRFHLEKLLRVKAHTLPPEQEELLALSAKALQTAHKSFSAINDADFKFGTVMDSKNEMHELTHGSYGVLLREHDRTLRANTFNTLHTKYLDYENTLCELLNGNVQGHLYVARAKKYSTCLEAALYPKNIDVNVYHSLIKAVNDNLDALHNYMALRQKVMNIRPLQLYDMYVPLTSTVHIKKSYKEAEGLVIESVAPLGPDYQNILRKGLQEERWVDRYENNNKRSGAYSSGCYDSMPYILMNYKGVLRDVFTLAHEAGHSMHSYLSHSAQPYQYGDYPIFLAEVASTFNEELLMRMMLKNSTDKNEQIYLINEKIEDIRATLFRQSMFAEFELLIHTLAEKDVPLTPKLLKEEYLKLNQKYFGPLVEVNDAAQVEWARIPHFYYNFYVFQYSTGISAALALAERVMNGGAAERDAYLGFLKGGCSKYPIELLQKAGVDMTTAAPVTAAIGTFRRLVKQLEELLSPT